MPAPSRTTDNKQNQKESTRSTEAIRQNGAAAPAFGAQHSLLSLHRSIGNRAFGQVLQAKLAISSPGDVYEQEADAEEELQMQTNSTVYRKQNLNDDEELQGKFAHSGTRTIFNGHQDKTSNQTSLPDTLKASLEHFSGMDLSSIRVHHNSSKPAQLNALAYTQGQEIHVAPGQEKHLPHEGWHIVQQLQGRVKPTAQVRGVAINDDAGLECEADVMGGKALQMKELGQATIGSAHQGTPYLGRGDQTRRNCNYDKLVQRQSDYSGFSSEEIEEYDYEPEEEFDKDSGKAAQSAIGETGGTNLGKVGRISRKEQYLRERPDPAKGDNINTTLKFNDWVFVEKKGGAKDEWYKVVSNKGKIGWIPSTAAALDPPEPEAELYQVQPGDKAINLVAQWYKPKGGFSRAWNPWADDPGDARFYVIALAFANKGRAGIKSPNDLTERNAFEKVEVIAPKTIWKPSRNFLNVLKDKVSSGSRLKSAWDTAVSIATEVVDFIVGGGAFIGGLVYGALESIYDLFAGVVELFGMIWDVLGSLFTGNIISDAKALWDNIKKIDPSVLVQDFKEKWNADGVADRWFFRGRVLGYVIMEIVMMFFSGGVLTAIKWVGKFGTIGKLLAKLPKVAEVASKMAKAAKGVKLPEKAVNLLKFKKVGKGAKILEGIDKGSISILKYLESAEHLAKRATSWEKYIARGGKKSKAAWEKTYDTLTRNRMRGKLAEEQFSQIMGGKPKDISVKVAGKDELRKIDNVLGSTAREVKSGPLKLTPFIKKQILKDIELIRAKSMKVEWHLLAGGDAKAIAALKKAGIDVIIY